MLPALFISLLGWVLAILTCQGCGLCLRRIAGLRSAPDGFTVFWLGFVGVLGFLQLWHLFAPIDWRTTTIVFAVGFSGWMALRGANLVRHSGLTWYQKTGLVLLACWLANAGLGPARNYDSGLYHFATIRWCNEYPIVPGLANLHERLGFNQSYFLFVALLNIYPLFNQGYHVASGLLVFLLAAQLFISTCRELRSRTFISPTQLMPCVLLPVVVLQGWSMNIASPSPDIVIFVCGFVVFLHLLIVLEADPSRTADSMMLVFALSVGAATVKLSFAVFGAVAMCVAMGLSWRRGTHRESMKWLVVILLCVAIPYVIRGSVLSGYPAFPIAAISWNFDWRVPADTTRDTAELIYAWARTPHADWHLVLGSWDWLDAWWERNLSLLQVKLCLAALGISMGLLLWAFWNSERNRRSWWGLPFLPVCAGLLAWFLTAPDPRFGNWLLCLLGGWAFASALWLSRRTTPRLVPILALTAVVLVIAGRPVVWPEKGFADLPQARTRIGVTQTGLRVVIPESLDDVRLWDAPLPSAPFFKPTLTLRGPELGDGFRIQESR